MHKQNLCKIIVNGGKELHVQKGQVLLTSLWRQNILVPSVCGGRGMCGVCKIRIVQGSEDIAITPAEEKRLTVEELNNQVRLSCQIRVDRDIAIEVPPEYLAIQRWQARCAAIEGFTCDIKRFRFELTPPARMNVIAGHYVQLVCPPYAEGIESTTRAFSVASNPVDNRHIELIVRKAPNGICTTWLFDYLQVGDPIEMTGPYGEFHLSESASPMIFIAGGSGMAPFVSILNHMKNTNLKRRVEFFFGCNTIEDLYLMQAMQSFREVMPDFHFIPVVACPSPQSNWQGQTGLVTEAVRRSYTDLSGYEGYLCGSPGMIDASVKVLLDMGLPQDKIYYDKFA
jgi:Na+-transporting NADH:ubiquinone oxidoreductase subunit F